MRKYIYVKFKVRVCQDVNWILLAEFGGHGNELILTYSRWFEGGRSYIDA
jgi:hypothetical protein